MHGQGERTLFRECIKEISVEDQKKVLQHIAWYGRWDDMFSLPLAVISDFLKTQFEADEAAMRGGSSVSLLAKWLPSENTSSKKTQVLAVSLFTAWGMKAHEYRKRVVALRKYIKLLEHLMSSNKWSEIDYEHLPSQALKKHVGAFKKHDVTRYEEYLKAVNSGEKKINTSTLYTYEIYDMVNKGQEDTANVMWNNLPDYTNGTNALVMADVSGSMSGRPMSVSVSLALYFAERNKGPFNGYFMTFTNRPQLVKITGKSLKQKMSSIGRDVGYNTNIDAAFKAILDAAVRDKTKQEEMPAVLYVISDMQFDSSDIGGNSKSNFQHAKESFEEAGYKLPHVVFWNVNARDNSPATKFDNNVTLISGSSQSTFRYAVEGKDPMELMMEVLGSERYARIEL